MLPSDVYLVVAVLSPLFIASKVVVAVTPFALWLPKANDIFPLSLGVVSTKSLEFLDGALPLPLFLITNWYTFSMVIPPTSTPSIIVPGLKVALSALNLESPITPLLFAAVDTSKLLSEVTPHSTFSVLVFLLVLLKYTSKAS